MKKFYDRCIFFSALMIELLCTFQMINSLANEQQVYNCLQLV